MNRCVLLYVVAAVVLVVLTVVVEIVHFKCIIIHIAKLE